MLVLTKQTLSCFLLLGLPATASAFARPTPRSSNKFKKQLSTPDISTNICISRGGSDTALNSVMLPAAMDAALKAGPLGVVALTGVAGSVVLPLTFYRQGYSFSVGYGLSVFAMGLAVFQSFEIGFSLSPLSLLATAVMFYGARLGTFLLLREFTVPSKKAQVKSFDKSPRLKRIPLALGVSMFYAFMTSPLLFAARASLENNVVMNVGLALAWLGAIVEAITDCQKFLVKRASTDENKFVGPTGGFYRLCRHPNYFAEVFYWFGLSVAGAPSFGNNPIAWVCAVLGFYGIFGIMSGAAKRLDGKQEEKYFGQEEYEKYKKDVPASLWPWVRP